MIGLFRRFRDWVAPEGFECDRCGFLVGDDQARRLHELWHDVADKTRVVEETFGLVRETGGRNR